MNIDGNGQMLIVSFWPADEIAAAFTRVNAAINKPDELQEMRLFVRTMNYFYEQATETPGDVDDLEMAELCRLAKKGLIAELGLEPEGKPV